MKTAKEPVKNIGSNHILRNREFSFSPKSQYEMAAAPLAAHSASLPFSNLYARRDSNPQPIAYKATALPLSYGRASPLIIYPFPSSEATSFRTWYSSPWVRSLKFGRAREKDRKLFFRKEKENVSGKKREPKDARPAGAGARVRRVRGRRAGIRNTARRRESN